MVAIEGELKHHQQVERQPDMVSVTNILAAAQADPGATYRDKSLLRLAVDGALSVYMTMYAQQAERSGHLSSGTQSLAHRSMMDKLQNTYQGIIQGLFRPSKSGIEKFIAKHSAARFIDAAFEIQLRNKFDLQVPRENINKRVATHVADIKHARMEEVLVNELAETPSQEKPAERPPIYTARYTRPAPVSMKPNVEYIIPETGEIRKKKKSNIAKNVAKLQKHLELSERPLPRDFGKHWSAVNRYNKDRGIKVKRGPGRHNPNNAPTTRSREFVDL